MYVDMSRDRQFYLGVKALITDPDGKILLLKSARRKPSDKWEPYWDLPGGKMQDLDIVGTLRREVREEIGVKKLEVENLFDVSVANFRIDKGEGNLMFLIYLCSIPGNSRLKLSQEHSQFRWVSRKEAATCLAYMLPKDSLKRILNAGIIR